MAIDLALVIVAVEQLERSVTFYRAVLEWRQASMFIAWLARDPIAFRHLLLAIQDGDALPAAQVIRVDHRRELATLRVSVTIATRISCLR